MIDFLVALILTSVPPSSERWCAPAEIDAQRALERAVLESPSAERLRAWHEQFAAAPHPAGSAGDAAVIAGLVRAFEDMGLAVERHDFETYLSRPVDAAVEIVAPEPMALAIKERALAEDPDTADPALTIGYNAYAATGDVEGTVVYANYGRREDFETLARLGVDLTDRVVIARYGGNFRGYKAKFAEAAGAAALIIYTDPHDAGYRRGAPYPEGGFANETSIQRGSIKTLPYPGDPLTPFVEATPDAARVDPASIALPTIPVQPVGWGAAQEILSRMTGPPLPRELQGGWQGGLPFAYRLEGGDDLRVRVRVEQERRLVRTSNVIATLPGDGAPDEVVVLGCHHDAWCHGASDPLAGLMVLVETARSFAEATRRGHRPRRTIVFAAWGAEEDGIIGSTEWCEAHRARLTEQAVAYVNLDMAATGPNFRASSAPLLEAVIEDAARDVPAIGAPPRSVHVEWTKGGALDPSFGSLGGGSDHVGFYCHLGIPSCGLSAGGGHGTAYHSNYDTLGWYRLVVGDDYEPALLVTRMATAVAARLAGATIVPLEPAGLTRAVARHLDALGERARDRDVDADLGDVESAFREATNRLERAYAGVLEDLAAWRLDEARVDRANRVIRSLERCWLDDAGLPGRPWYRSLYAASDPDSGYAAWILPALREAIDDADRAAIARERARLLDVASRLDAAAAELEQVGAE